MANKCIYDDIMECLRTTRRTTPAVSVSPEVMQEFMTDYPRARKTPAEQQPVCASAAEEPPYVPQMKIPQEVVSTPAAPVLADPAQVASMDWNALQNATMQCQGCKLCSTRRNVVFEDGNRKAELLFFGEGPGADEDAQGVPFVGRAGELLTKMIQAMKFTREEVYICNTVKCRPPGNRNPEPDELAACRAFAERQIELVHPKVIVVLGAVALRFLFPRVYGGIRNLRGHWMAYHDIQVMPTYHPAYLLRDPQAKKETWADLQQVMAVFGKTPVRKGH